MLDGCVLQFGTAFQPELPLDLLPVRVDRVVAQVQTYGDRLARQAFSKELEDLQFAVAEQVHRRTGSGANGANGATDQRAAQSPAQVAAASKHQAQGLQGVSLSLGLADVAVGTGLERTLGVKRFFVRRQCEDFSRIAVDLQTLDQIQSAAAFAEGNVDGDQVGWVGRDERQGIGHRRGLATDLHVGLRLDAGPQPFADERVVVDDQDPGLTCRVHGDQANAPLNVGSSAKKYDIH